MALNRNYLGHDREFRGGTGNSNTFTTDAFTVPDDGSLLVVFVAAMTHNLTGDFTSEVTVSDSQGLTWTQVAAAAGTAAYARYVTAFVADGADAGNITVSVDTGSRDMRAYFVWVFSYTGHDPSNPVGAVGSAAPSWSSGSSPANVTLDLSSAPDASSEVLVVKHTDVAVDITQDHLVGTEIYDDGSSNSGYGSVAVLVQTGSTNQSGLGWTVTPNSTPPAWAVGSAIAGVEILAAGDTPAPATPGYLQVDNTATARAWTTDPSFYSSGTIEVVACVAFPSWYPSAFATRSISGSGTSTTAWAFRHVVNSDATGTTPRFSWWDSDGTQHDADAGDVSDGTIFPSDGDHKWLRVVFNPDTGSGHSAQFFHSDDPINTDPAAVTWTALATDTGAATTVRTGAGNAGFVGGHAGTGSPGGNGQHYFSSAAYNGSVVWSPDFRDDTQGWSNPPGEDDQGNTWTFAGNAVWVPPTDDAQDLEGTALSVAPSFPGGQVSPGPVNLVGSVLAATTTFPAGDVTTSVEVAGQLLSVPVSFPQGETSQAYGIHGTLLEASPTFPGGTVDRGPVTLTGSALGVSPVFPGGAVSPGAVTLSGTPLTAGVGFPGGRVRPVVVHPDGPATVTVDPIPPAEVALDILVGTAEYA